MSMSGLLRNVVPLFTIIAVLIPAAWGQNQLDGRSEEASLPQFSEAATPPQLISDGDVQLRVEASANSAKIAEPIDVTLIFEAPLGTRATLPMTAATLGELDVIERQVVEGLPIDGDPDRRRWTCRLTLESLDAGQHLVPSLEVIYRLAGDEGDRSVQNSIRSLAFSVEIASVIDGDHDPKDFRDIKDAIAAREEPTQRDYFVWWSIAGSLAAAILFALFIWSRRDRKPVPYEWATQELDRVETQVRSSQMGTLEGYTSLSLILRDYLEQELHIPASSQSAEELRLELSERSFPNATTERLTQFLSESDEIRFSGDVVPNSSQLTTPIETVRDLIRQVNLDRNASPARSD